MSAKQFPRGSSDDECSLPCFPSFPNPLLKLSHLNAGAEPIFHRHHHQRRKMRKASSKCVLQRLFQSQLEQQVRHDDEKDPSLGKRVAFVGGCAAVCKTLAIFAAFSVSQNEVKAFPDSHSFC